MKKRFVFVSALVSAMVLAACGGGAEEESPPVASSDMTLSVNASVAPALENEVFTFSAVPAFGTSTTTTVEVTEADGPTDSFRIASGGATATGSLEYGSCIFRITASTFPADHPLAAGKTVTVSTCVVKVFTKGKPAQQAVAMSATLQLGSAVSLNTEVTVEIKENGQVVINGDSAGTVTLAPATGATGGS